MVPVAIFVDVGPGHLTGTVGSIEVCQKVLQAVLVSSFTHYLPDQVGGDRHSTVRGLFILPEEKKQITEFFRII